MPQLDKVTFLAQFFWFILFYLGVYFYFVKFFLPKMGRIFKLRQERIQNQSVDSTELITPTSKWVLEGLQSTQSNVQTHLTHTKGWVDQHLQKLSQQSHQFTMTTLAKMKAKNALQQHHLSKFKGSETSRTRFILKKLASNKAGSETSRTPVSQNKLTSKKSASKKSASKKAS